MFSALFGGGSSHAPPAAAPATGAGTVAAGAPSGVAPGTTPDQFRKQQQAYYSQLFSGTGQLGPGGELPQGIQQNIDRQAALI